MDLEKIWQLYKEYVGCMPTSERAKNMARELADDIFLAVIAVAFSPGCHDLTREAFLEKFLEEYHIDVF